MPGYSAKPLASKLGLKPGFRILLRDAPPDFPAALGTLPEGSEVVFSGRPAEADVVLIFAREALALRTALPPVAAALSRHAMLWVAWPKKASGQKTDLTDNVVREIGLATGLVDVKVCAVTEIWSGLKFLHRRSQMRFPCTQSEA